MNRKVLPLSLFALLLLSSCYFEKLTKEDCELLNYQRYRGGPHSASKFKKYCENMEIPDITSVCNTALAALTLGMPEKELKEKWGENILLCFHDSTLQKHLSKESDE